MTSQRTASDGRTGRFPRRVRSLAALGTVTLVTLGGCGGEPKRQDVSGTVNWKGQPLSQGTIEFTPAVGADLPVGALITDGRYGLPNPPGLAPGGYKVRIHSRGGGQTTGRRSPDIDMADPEAGEQIPEIYNDQTTLAAEVTAGGPNAFAFELNGDRKKAKPAKRPK